MFSEIQGIGLLKVEKGNQVKAAGIQEITNHSPSGGRVRS